MIYKGFIAIFEKNALENIDCKNVGQFIQASVCWTQVSGWRLILLIVYIVTYWIEIDIKKIFYVCESSFRLLCSTVHILMV